MDRSQKQGSGTCKWLKQFLRFIKKCMSAIEVMVLQIKLGENMNIYIPR